MINRNQVFTKFDLNADQRDIFDRLTLAQQRRLIKVLETKQRTGKRRVIKASGNPRRAKVLQDDSQDIINQYQDHLH
ncbi:hypothetical protein FD724_08825 [Nostoc sp. C057]|uniref:hypothetical protein n=1 Tax=Nostoc sp. C057 TaxID=2576903 RepID=UPI0015C304CA|nr:hypothetical protein [Nostoc sp. C057]QLE48216.1 hypothetical protein FD724_08825 [Nostoc sp. C057]